MSSGPIIKLWDTKIRGMVDVDVTTLSNEQLLEEYAAECEGESRRISSDPPGYRQELYDEIMRRMR